MCEKYVTKKSAGVRNPQTRNRELSANEKQIVLKVYNIIRKIVNLL